ncbi:hypothetical protein MTR67_046462 [Solanum verrucosum]|uniref:Uncharacterized protein n=1 Tax=Solanum verrucosum TaxID=315347 RepID=A0AAF0UUW7_SOLVR|nr:hypothetical protein MTR67_046462 [Solanum verrucosum]
MAMDDRLRWLMTLLDLEKMTRRMELWGMKKENQKQDCIKGVAEMENQDLITEMDDLHHINNNKNKEQMKMKMKMNQQEEEEEEDEEEECFCTSILSLQVRTTRKWICIPYQATGWTKEKTGSDKVEADCQGRVCNLIFCPFVKMKNNRDHTFFFLFEFLELTTAKQYH